MNGLPDALFVIDVGYQKIAVAEANKLGIPVDRRGRHQPFARRHRLRDSGQRRLEPRDPAVRARHRRRDPGRPQRQSLKEIVAASATSSSKSRKRKKRRAKRRRLMHKRGASPFFCNGQWRCKSMAEITAGMVKELREKTERSMMECKKALTEAGGDMTKAEELLRIKRGNKASKAAGRVAAEGVVGAYVVGRRQARRDGRSQLRDRLRREERRFPRVRAQLAELVATQNPARRRGAVGARARRRRRSKQRAQALVQKIGENISDPPLRAHRRRKGKLAHYVHGGREDRRAGRRRGRRRALGKDLAHAHRGRQARVR